MKPTSIVVDAPICIGNWCPHNYGGGYRRLDDADHRRSPIRSTPSPCSLSIVARRRQRQARPRAHHQDRARHGHHHAAARHAVAADRRRRRHVLDHAGAYAHLPQSRHEGRRRTPSSKCAPATASWSGASTATGRSRSRCCRPKSPHDMINMMNSVVENGTGRRARLDGIAAAGKTGTTNAYRDAWFMGYTGNFVCGVWFGNDDYSSTNRMTGGSLPAMTWHDDHGLRPPGHRDQTAARHCRCRTTRQPARSPKLKAKPASRRRRRGRSC